MSSQQGPPPRPWFRLATMVRPPPPPPTAAPPAQPNQRPAPSRPAYIRPTFTATTPPPQTTPIPPPQQPNPTPSPPRPTPSPVPASNVVESPTPAPPTPSQPTPPPVPTPNVKEVMEPLAAPTLQGPSPVPATTVVDPPILPPSPPSSLDPPTSPSRKPPQSSRPPTPPQEPKTPKDVVAPLPQSLTPTHSPITTTRVVTTSFSPPKSVKPLETTPPPVTKASSPPLVMPPAQPPQSSPKKPYLIPSPPSSPPRAHQSEHPLPPSSPPKMISPLSSTMHPPSPLLLPSLKQKPYNEIPPDYNKKTVLVQETKEKPKNSASAYNNKHIGGIHTHNPSRKPETYKKQWDSEEAGKNTITIAGENKGAIMKITPFGVKKPESGDTFNINKHNPTTSSNGEIPKTDLKGQNKNQQSKPLLKTSFLNSNVQGVNNSIVYNSSISHHDPGIHLVISTKPDGDFRFHSKEHKKE